MGKVESRTIELIWASPRELLNTYQASEIGGHIITTTTDFKKIKFSWT
jgi:transaldolase